MRNSISRVLALAAAACIGRAVDTLAEAAGPE